MASNYDKIAGSYDFISRIVFRNALVDAQVCLLKYVPANSRILIVGGGTGWILEEFAKIHSDGLMIDYVESSAKMIAISKKRDCKNNEVNFINLPIEDYATEKKYDVIMTPFLFDNFLIDKIKIVFNQLDSMLIKNGVWLYADFVYDKNISRLWQKALLKLMYFFFRITSNIETRELISMDGFFKPCYTKLMEAPHFNNFIKSVAYQKQ